MDHDTKKDAGTPRFGLLLLVCLGTIALLGGLTWVMATYFPNFPG